MVKGQWARSRWFRLWVFVFLAWPRPAPARFCQLVFFNFVCCFSWHFWCVRRDLPMVFKWFRLYILFFFSSSNSAMFLFVASLIFFSVLQRSWTVLLKKMLLCILALHHCRFRKNEKNPPSHQLTFHQKLTCRNGRLHGPFHQPSSRLGRGSCSYISRGESTTSGWRKK